MSNYQAHEARRKARLNARQPHAVILTTRQAQYLLVALENYLPQQPGEAMVANGLERKLRAAVTKASD